MTYPFTINGRTYTEADFEPYTYAKTFPLLMADLATVTAGTVGAVGTAQQLAAAMAAGPVANVQRRGRGLTGVVSPDPLDASRVLPTKGQVFRPGITLDGTFARAGAGSYFDGAGILRSAASGAARYDAHPLTGEHLGLLFELARTNAVTYSSEFDNAAWVKNTMTVTPNVAGIIAPDGTATADKVIADTGLIGFMNRSVTVAQNGVYTLSVFAKSAELSSFSILVPGATFTNAANRTATFNLSAKTATNTGVVGTEFSSKIQELNNGWFRCSVTFTVQTAITSASPQFYRSAANGDGASGLYQWGAQFETGASATSYIATVAAAVARPADTLTHANGTWFNPTEGTFFYEFQSNSAATETTIIGGLSNTAAPSFNDVMYTQIASTGAVQTVIRSGGVGLANLASSISGGRSVLHRAAYAYKSGDHAMSVDGAAVVTSAVAMPAAMDRWVVGSAPWAAGGNSLNGGLVDARYVPRRLSNDLLQRMTA